MTRFAINADGKFIVNAEGKHVTYSRCFPETLTVALSGFAGAFPDRSEIDLSITACFGSGAAGYVQAPAPDEASGAVFGPIITAPGSGYAVLGRVAPRVMLWVVGTGTGAELTPVVVEDEDECGRPIWIIDSVTIDDPGSGYDESAYIISQIGNFPEYKAVAGSVTGTGARIRVEWQDSADLWVIGSIEIIDQGTGYTVGDTFTVGTGVTLTVSAVNGSGVILALTSNQTETYPVLAAFGFFSLAPVLPRTEPTLAIEDYGSGAVLTVNVGVLSGTPPLTWQITSVVVVDGGDDNYYSDGDYIYISEDPANSGEGSETLIVRTNRSTPSYDFSGGNSDAVLSPSYTSNGYTDPDNTWYLDSVSVTSGGTGYYDGEYLFLTPTDFYRDIDLSTPAVQVRTVRDEPAVHTTPSSVTGTGADISLTLTAGTDFEGRDSWSATGYSIDDAGTGYTVGDTFDIETSDGYTLSTGTVEVTTVGGSGEITGVSITSGGEFFLDTGVIDIAEVVWPGEAYHDDGSIHSIEVVAGGEFWENGDSIDNVTIDYQNDMYVEDPSEDPLLADVDVEVADENDPAGTGATLTANINDDVESPQFGQITGFTLDAGGTGYNGNLWIKPCCNWWDGKSIVVKRGRYPCASRLSNGCLYMLCEPAYHMRESVEYEAIPDTVTGTDAVITSGSSTNSDNTDPFGAPLYYPSGFVISDPGSGYAVDDIFELAVIEGTFLCWLVGGVAGDEPYRLRVTAVNGTGGITAVTLDNPPSYDHRAGGYKTNELIDPSGRNTACFSEHRLCTSNAGTARRGTVIVKYHGPDSPPTVLVRSEAPAGSGSSDPPPDGYAASCDVDMESTTLVAPGDPYEFTATHPNGATAVVTEGGTYDPDADYGGAKSCHGCCEGGDVPPEEITASWTRLVAEDFAISSPFSGSIFTRVISYVPPDSDVVLTIDFGFPSYRVRWQGVIPYTPGIYPNDINFELITIACRSSGGSARSFTVDRSVDDPTNWNINQETVKCAVCSGCRTYLVASLIGWESGGRISPAAILDSDSCSTWCEAVPACHPTGKSFDLWAVGSVPPDPIAWTKIGTLTLP
jgi:hypothetical protein